MRRTLILFKTDGVIGLTHISFRQVFAAVVEPFVIMHNIEEPVCSVPVYFSIFTGIVKDERVRENEGPMVAQAGGGVQEGCFPGINISTGSGKGKIEVNLPSKRGEVFVRRIP
jgi:hypothetical protein